MDQRRRPIPRRTTARPMYIIAMPKLPRNLMNPASSLEEERERVSETVGRTGPVRSGTNARVPGAAVEVREVGQPALSFRSVLAVPPSREDTDLAVLDPSELGVLLRPQAVLRRPRRRTVSCPLSPIPRRPRKGFVQHHGPGGEHDGRVVGTVLVVEGDEVVDDEVHKVVALLGHHDVVRDADGHGGGEDDVEVEEGIHALLAPDVEVHVDASVVVEDKVPDGVGALDRVGVAVERREEPRVMRGDELARRGVGPEDILTAAPRQKRGRRGVVC